MLDSMKSSLRIWGTVGAGQDVDGGGVGLEAVGRDAAHNPDAAGDGDAGADLQGRGGHAVIDAFAGYGAADDQAEIVVRPSGQALLGLRPAHHADGRRNGSAANGQRGRAAVVGDRAGALRAVLDAVAVEVGGGRAGRAHRGRADQDAAADVAGDDHRARGLLHLVGVGGLLQVVQRARRRGTDGVGVAGVGDRRIDRDAAAHVAAEVDGAGIGALGGDGAGDLHLSGDGPAGERADRGSVVAGVGDRA